MAKKKRGDDDVPRADVGVVMILSLFLILFTFFILLNSIAVLDQKRTRVAIGSLTGAFGSFKGGLSPLKTGESVMPPSAPIVMDELSVNDLLSLIDRRMMGAIKIESKMDNGIITIRKDILFEGTSLRISPSVKPLLNKLCDLINQGAYPVKIAGHTDNRPAEEKGYQSNWELSTLMAIQILRYMVEKGNVLPGRFTAYGGGDQNPVASNDTRQSRAQNRRVTISLDYKAQHRMKRIFKDKKSAFITYKKFDFRIFK